MTNKIIEKKTTRQPNSIQPDLIQLKDVWVHEFLNLLWVVILPTRYIWVGFKKIINMSNPTHEHLYLAETDPEFFSEETLVKMIKIIIYLKKKHNPTTQLNPTRSNPTQKCLGSWISKFTLGCDFVNPIYMSWVQKNY